MKTLIATIITSLMLATAAQATPFNTEPTTTQEIQLAYYGQVNSNGTTRTNYVNGYTKSNGTHVNGYYRS